MLLYRSLMKLIATNEAKDVDYQRIQEIATELNGQFTKDYAMWFKEMIHQQIRLKPPQEMELIQAAVPHREIKTGHLRKMGNNVKNWKNRYFVAYNKAANYAIVYYEDEASMKEKGRINCCGYAVEKFSRDEEKLYGTMGLKLIHPDETKRTWYVRCETFKDQSDWLTVFSNACRKATADPFQSSLFLSTFQTALKATKAAYGYFGCCDAFGSEFEMLMQLTAMVVAREVLDEYFQSKQKSVRSMSTAAGHRSYSTSGSSNPTQVQMNAHMQAVRVNVNNILVPIVQNTLKCCHTTADSLQASYVSFATSLAQTLQDKEMAIADLLAPAMASLVENLVYELKYETCKPILNKIFNDLVSAHLTCVQTLIVTVAQGLIPIVLSISDGMEMDKAKRSAMGTLERIEGSVEDPDGFLTEAYGVLWKMHSEHLLDIEDKLEASNLSSFTVYSLCIEDIQTLTRNACATIASGLISPEVPVLGNMRQTLDLLKDVLRRLEHDTALTIQRRLHQILRDAMEAKVQELLIAPALDRVHAAQHLLTGCPLNIHLNCVGERLIRDRIDAFLSDLLRSYKEDVHKQLEDADLWMGIQDLLPVV